LKARFAALAALTLLILTGSAAADSDTYERITNYASDISIARSGQITVTETITVVAADDEIKHGIFRDFPTSYRDHLGRVVHIDFSVLGVTRDGQPTPYTVESISDGQRIKIGDADTDLTPGTYTYAITYVADREIGFFDKYDELYWNVTGTQWKFAIEHAEATIHLPPGAHIVQSAFYTGDEGSKDQNATSNIVSDDTIHFTTTTQLTEMQGLTVAVGFSKGAVIAPTARQLRDQFIRDNASLIASIAGFLFLLLYFGVTWLEFGRDPAHGTIVPLFAPPDGLSPAAVRYIHRMAYDRKSYSASLINMAVKGYLIISEASGAYTLTRTGKSEAECGLAHGEVAIANKLFDGVNDSIEMKQENHSDIAASITALKTSLKSEYETSYFVTNQHWFFGGLAILAITTIATAFLSEDVGTVGGMMFWLSGWSLGTAFLVHRAWDSWGMVINGPGSRFLNAIQAIFITAFALPFVGGWLFGAYMMREGISPIAGGLLLLGGILAYVFYHLLKAPTLIGAKARDQMEGFRLFLAATEKDRLEVLNPPNITPALFEKFLPYAIALDCENRWSKKFEAEAAHAADGASGGSTYVPIWWSGSNFGSVGAAGFASGLGASLAASAASASTAPGSSSGSGGGGFSGGGGGGGGGGGW
jgi:uncharacterized membrane protein YgcG